MELLSGLHGGGTSLIVVTHDIAVGARAKRLITIRDGRVVGDAAQG